MTDGSPTHERLGGGRAELVAVAGSRRWCDALVVQAYVAALPEDTVVVTGRAIGADTIAREAALARGLLVVDVPAAKQHWKRYGRSAGHRRNALIAVLADRLQAFWDGSSPGTRDVVDSFRRLGKPVTVTRGPSRDTTRAREQREQREEREERER
jgi:hypothetical protein